MGREQFIESLRVASRLLPPPHVRSDQGPQTNAELTAGIHGADLWLTPESVEGFDPADFDDWPTKDREMLAKEVDAFLEVVERVPANKPANKATLNRARKHLERAIQIVRQRLVPEWIDAQQKMMHEAMAAAEAKGWYAQMDKREVSESLLGRYKAPRLRIRTQDSEVVLDPVARFGSGRQGVVDLVILPAYETAYLVAFKNGQWRIISPRGNAQGKPFTQATLVSTITALSRS